MLPPYLCAIVGSPAAACPNEPRTCKACSVCQTRMPQCTRFDGPFSRTSLVLEKMGKEAYEPTGSVWLFFRAFSATRVENLRYHNWSVKYPKLIFDRSHVNASNDVPAWKVIDLWTMDRLCLHGPNSTVGGQRKQRMESEKAFRFPSLAVWGWTVNHSRSTLVSPCVAAFISGAYNFLQNKN